jgi:hypothetical protein
MSHQVQGNKSTILLSVLGGTLSSFYKAIQAEDLVRTCLLAAIGTIVSFVVTLVLKKMFRKWMQ